MDVIRSAIARARARIVMQRGLETLGWLLLAAAGASVVLVLVERLFALAVPWWVHGLLFAAAVVAAPVIAWIKRPSHNHVAAVLDDRLHLKDRLGTALFAESLGDDPLARHVRDDARRVAGDLRVTQATPIRLNRTWAAAPAVGAVALALAAALPSYDLFGIEARQYQRHAERRAAEAERERLAQAREMARQMTADERPDELADPDDVLAQLASLTDEDLANPRARREMEARLSDVRDRLDDQLDAHAREQQALRNALSQLDTDERGPADRLTDALRRGDLGAAQRELDRLAQQIESGEMSDADRQRLQEQLEELRDRLDELAADAERRAEQAERDLRDELREQGLSEDEIDQLAQRDFDRDALREALEQRHREQGMDEQEAAERAEQQADQLQELQRQAEQQRRTASQCQGLGDCMGSAAAAAGGGAGAGSGDGAAFRQEAWAAQRHLSDLAGDEQRAARLARARDELDEAMQGALAETDGERPADRAGGASQQQRQRVAQAPTGSDADDGGGVGGDEGGTGASDTPLGTPRQHDVERGATQHVPATTQGRVIASWTAEGGEASPGEAHRGFDQAVTEAREDADRAVAEDRVPRQYHRLIRDYFQQLPETVDEQ